MGWLVLLLLIGAALGLLWLLKVRGGLLTASVAALLLGASGYALQGRPSLPAAPAQGIAESDTVPLAQARHAFFGEFTGDETWLRMSEALARTGDTENAVAIMKNAVGRYPRNPQLWIGLGNALVDHAHVLTPPAKLAYQRAADLQPGYPAAPFFYGVALARSGDPDAAVAVWQRALAKSPKDASWRPLLEAGIAALSPSPPAATR